MNFYFANNYAEVGYKIHPNYQQKDFISETLKAILNFCCNNLHLKTIDAFTHKNNFASITLFKKYHFIFQSKRKNDDFNQNRIFKLENNI